MPDAQISLSIYLLRMDRVSSFESSLSAATAGQPLTPPLDGYVIPLPSGERVPQWVCPILVAHWPLGLVMRLMYSMPYEHHQDVFSQPIVGGERPHAVLS